MSWLDFIDKYNRELFALIGVFVGGIIGFIGAIYSSRTQTRNLKMSLAHEDSLKHKFLLKEKYEKIFEKMTIVQSLIYFEFMNDIFVALARREINNSSNEIISNQRLLEKLGALEKRIDQELILVNSLTYLYLPAMHKTVTEAQQLLHATIGICEMHLQFYIAQEKNDLSSLISLDEAQKVIALDELKVQMKNWLAHFDNNYFVDKIMNFSEISKEFDKHFQEIVITVQTIAREEMSRLLPEKV